MLRNTNGIVRRCKGLCFLFSAVGMSRCSPRKLMTAVSASTSRAPGPAMMGVYIYDALQFGFMSKQAQILFVQSRDLGRQPLAPVGAMNQMDDQPNDEGDRASLGSGDRGKSIGDLHGRNTAHRWLGSPSQFHLPDERSHETLVNII
jgi:hypothetical protein